MNGAGQDWERHLPPWKVFPAFAPAMLPATQGAEEAWFDQEWRPFWASLSPLERQAYLAHWKATTEWRDALEFFFSKPDDFDPEQDARESEAYLKECPSAAGQPKRSLWKRITGRF